MVTKFKYRPRIDHWPYGFWTGLVAVLVRGESCFTWEHDQHILKCLALDGHNFLLPSHNQSKFFSFEQWMKMVPFQFETRKNYFKNKLIGSVLNAFIYLMLYFSIIVLQSIFSNSKVIFMEELSVKLLSSFEPFFHPPTTISPVLVLVPK
jgi:hypothetical protein